MVRHTIFTFLFWTGMLLQWYVLFTEILSPQPLPGTMGWIDEEFYAYLISFLALGSLFSLLIGRLRRGGWMMASCLLIVLLCLGAVAYYSDYYENAGELPYSIDFDGENPISAYREAMPAKIGVMYYLLWYYAAMAGVLWVITRRRKQVR